MKLYVVPSSPRHVREAIGPARVRNVLVSFAAIRPGSIPEWRAAFAEAGVTSVLLDSGAYSVMTRGITIRLPDYYRVIEELRPTRYAALDVIGDPIATKRNLARMVDDGYRSMPVYTRGAPVTDLRDLAEQYDYIAVGGIARVGNIPRRAKQKITMDEMRRCLDTVFNITRDHVRVHGFGIGRSDLMNEYPFASCDSSSSTVATSLGNLYDLEGVTLSQRKVTTKRENATRMPHLTHVAGIDRGKANRSREMHNLRQVAELESRLTSLWDRRGILWPEEAAWC